MGAVFLLLAVGGVLLAVLWPSAPADLSRERPLPILDAASPARSAAAATAPAGFVDLLRRYLEDRRLAVAPGGREADLICRLPRGYSFYAINAGLTAAVARWGGSVSSGEETAAAGGRQILDLAVTRGGEARRVRLERVPEDPDEALLVFVLEVSGEEPSALIDAFLDLPIPLTLAILPGGLRSRSAERRAAEKGRSYLLLLPGEDEESTRPSAGRWMLAAGMEPPQVRSILEGRSGDLEGAAGIEGRLGRKAGRDPVLGRAVVDLLAARGLFYLDGGHEGETVLPAEGARRGVRCLSADSFLDADPTPTPSSMLRRLREARDLALSTGSAIVLARARPGTLEFLRAAADSIPPWGCRPAGLGALLR